MLNRVIASRYRIGDKICSNSLADRYRAIDQKNGRQVVIDIIREEIKRLPLPSQIHFKREVEAISKIDHDNLLKVYALGEVGGT